MSYSVQNLKTDLAGVMHGTTNNQVENINGVINRAARQLLLDLDPQETIRIVQFVNPIFNSVFDYPVADDLKGTGLIDIRPQVDRLPSDVWLQTYNQDFDVWKSNLFASSNMFTFNFNTALKTIRINAPFLNPPVVLNQAESTTDNGTWTASGTASNLITNNTNFVQGAGSLQFDVTSGSAILTNSTSSAVDLSDFVNQSSLFVWVYVPTGTSLTSVSLKWGSSASAYYSGTVTENQQGVAFVNGWNLCQFDWASATTTGSPDSSAVDYLQVTLAVTASMTGCLVNGIQSVLGSILEYEYYSKYMFRDSSTGAFQETVTDDSNLINLDTESFNLLFNLTAYFATQQQEGADALGFDSNFFGQEYLKGLKRYQGLTKSQRQKPQGIYYKKPNVSNSRFIGRRFNV